MFNQKDILRKIINKQLKRCDIKNIKIEEVSETNTKNINIQMGANSNLSIRDLEALINCYCKEVKIEVN